MVKSWAYPGWVAANTAFAPPAAAGVGQFTGVRSLTVVPQPSGTSFTAAFTCAGVPSGASLSAGQVAALVASQELVCGEAIPEYSFVIADLVGVGESPYTP